MSEIRPLRAVETPPNPPPAQRGSSGAASAAPAPANAPMGPNPALRIDPSLGLVVLEFRNDQGEVAATLPTSRELEAYRAAARTAGKAITSVRGLDGRDPEGTPAAGQETRAEPRGAPASFAASDPGSHATVKATAKA